MEPFSIFWMSPYQKVVATDDIIDGVDVFTFITDIEDEETWQYRAKEDLDFIFVEGIRANQFEFPLTVGMNWVLDTGYHGPWDITVDWMENIVVPAGTFNGFEISCDLSTDGVSEGEIIYYYVPEVKWVAKLVVIQDGEITYEMSLSEYNIMDYEPDSSTDKDETPGFELIIVFLAFILIIFLKRKKRF